MRMNRTVASIAVAMAVGEAMAQSATSNSATGSNATKDADNLPEVIVTARRVNERLQDVPLSINVLSSKELTDRGLASISTLSEFTPGLSYTPNFGRTGERPVVRGISASQTYAPQPVSVFVDGVYKRDGALGLLLDDAERVEVIKGPQSALYGRATYAGAINYVTVKPSQEINGTVSVTVGQAGEASAFGALSFPIVKDLLAARIKAKHYEFDGQYTNALTGHKIGEERSDVVGVMLSFTPSKSFDALLAVDTAKDRDGMFPVAVRPVPIQAGGVITNQNGSTNVPNGGSCNGRTINIVGNNPVTGLPDASVPAALATRLNGRACGAATFSGTTVRLNEADLMSYTDPITGTSYGNIAGLDREIDRYALTLNFHFGGGYTLTSQTAVTRQRSNLGADQSYSGVRFSPFNTAWTTYDRDKLDYSSQELRLTSPQNQALTWLVGGYMYKERGEGRTTSVIARNSAQQVVPDYMRDKAGTNVDSVAPFGRVQYQIDKTMRVSLEGRSNSEKVEAVGTPLGIAKVTAGTCVAGQPCVVSGKKTFKDFSPRLTFDYKPAENMLYYAQVAKGSKSGGFNTAPGLPASSFTYDGEKITSYEAGIKNQLFERKMEWSLALFRNDIDGLQLSNSYVATNPVTGLTTNNTLVNNVGKARTQGGWRSVLPSRQPTG